MLSSQNDLFVYGDQSVEVPAHLNFGKYMLDRLRAKNDGTTAVENAATGEKITYREFAQYAVSLASSLSELGVRPGDTVGVASEKRVTLVPTALAVILTGAAYTPYDLQSGRAGIKHKLYLTRPKYLICSPSFWKSYKDILQEIDFIETYICFDECDDIKLSVKELTSRQVDVMKFEPAIVQGQTDTALVLYSSGTTGMPKGVQLTHLNCILNSLPKDFEDDSLKTAFVFGEWYHNYDIFMTYKFLSAGRKIVYADKVTPESTLKSIEQCQVNIAMLVPSLVGYLSKAEDVNKYDLSSLKIIYCRSSPLHKKTIEAIKQRFQSVKKLIQGYGMTEAGELTSESWGTKGPKTGSVGMASPGITLKIVDVVTRKVLGANQRGEICLRGPVLMKGYIHVNPATYLDDEGFFLTGDLGYYDEDKYFYIVDRLKEIISYDGCKFMLNPHYVKVAPLELETILQLHGGVREAGVVGRPAGELGELPMAFVVRQPGSDVTEQELLDHVETEVPPYMQLRGGVQFVSELPRNPRGKLLRRRLREMLTVSQ